MPYTPPSKSPAQSAPTSPDSSRRPSFHGSSTGSSPRASLPRSSSYLTKHRRTPPAAALNHGHVSQPSPEATSEDLKQLLTSNLIRQSPPPVTDGKSMPKGAVISPPESGSSDEDDLPEMRGRKIENLKELHAAISKIPQKREGSPDSKPPPKDAGVLLVTPKQIQTAAEVMHISFSTSSLDDLKHSRRVSHNRAMTMPDVAPKSTVASTTNSSEDEEDDIPPRPSMVRKKSGELVRPALRPASRRRPSSMPGTPTFSKAVHFDSHLEHVRHFLQVDRPLAVSAGSSPVDNYDSDSEYPFGVENGKPVARTPPFEWEIKINSFPAETPARKALPVRLERVWLSNDHKFLIGSIVVANLAFNKAVVCRFTVDYWKTTSEVAAEYNCDVTPKGSELGFDRFQFSIKLTDLANLENKTLFFAIKYSVNGQEFWDNNNGTNFQVDFHKKMLPQNGKKPVGAANRPANGLPRSHRRSNPMAAPRPKSMPVGFDDFGDKSVNFDQSVHDYLGESAPTPIRLKGSKASASIPSDNLSIRLAAPSGQAFANRYDFGASLTAAMNAAKDTFTLRPETAQQRPSRRGPPLVTKQGKPVAKESQPSMGNNHSAAIQTMPTVPGTGSHGASNIASSTYEEIVNKYCFFGSKQSSPQLQDGTAAVGKFDGADDFSTRSTNSPWSSATGSPFLSQRASSQRQAASSDTNSYFQPTARMMPVGASPDVSPLGNQIIRADSPTGNARSSTSVMGQSPGFSASPTSMVGGFQPFTGTSPHEFASYNLHDRFSFFGSDAHAATAIRGN